jgi:alcohol dehydrogenase class IV
LPERLVAVGFQTIAVVTGGHSLRESDHWGAFLKALDAGGISYRDYRSHGEPSPEFVDATAEELRSDPPDAVVAIGGGSVIDAGKAVAAMLAEDGSVVEYLEGVGTRSPSGDKIPFVAAPTTSGTGSEATKNAVISSVGPNGYKKSLRHDNYVPDMAFVDPALIRSCPPSVTAASGMDAITQLLEAYVSANSSALTDALAESGLGAAGQSFKRAVEHGDEDLEARAGMAYAAYLSGVTLANAGLGVVHGIASPVGARYPAPHGVVCGTLIGEATKLSVAWLRQRGAAAALAKYARAAELLTGTPFADTDEACDALVELLSAWTDQLAIPRLGEYGVVGADAPEIARASGIKNSPAHLSEDDLVRLIQARV